MEGNGGNHGRSHYIRLLKSIHGPPSWTSNLAIKAFQTWIYFITDKGQIEPRLEVCIRLYLSRKSRKEASQYESGSLVPLKLELAYLHSLHRSGFLSEGETCIYSRFWHLRGVLQSRFNTARLFVGAGSTNPTAQLTDCEYYQLPLLTLCASGPVHGELLHKVNS